MKRTLSVPSLRWLFATRAIGGLVGAVVALYVLSGIQASSEFEPYVLALRVGIVVVVSALVAKDQVTRRGLTRVAVDDRFLYVSSYLDSTEEAMPLENIVRVTQWRGRTLRPVTIDLRTPSRFGTRIRFQPKPQLGLAMTEDAIVDELRKLARLG